MDAKGAKESLDRLITKQRVAFYKPIQVAEILNHVRSGKEITINDVPNVETYRNPSKRWRDSVTRELIDQVSTSSQKFQDNLFDRNAMPPETLSVLAKENTKYPGVVERYIYQHFRLRQQRIARLAELLRDATFAAFRLDSFLGEFARDRSIKRSIDKAYEIVVYALFNTLVKHMRVKIEVQADPSQIDLLRAFEEFARLVLGIDAEHPSLTIEASLYRAGATNAADRGLDMWANFGAVVQVKHLTLTDQLADDICTEVAADRIIIVCKDSEKETIERVLQQLGHRVRGVIVQSQLIRWYDEALRGRFSGL